MVCTSSQSWQKYHPFQYDTSMALKWRYSIHSHTSIDTSSILCTSCEIRGGLLPNTYLSSGAPTRSVSPPTKVTRRRNRPKSIDISIHTSVEIEGPWPKTWVFRSRFPYFFPIFISSKKMGLHFLKLLCTGHIGARCPYVRTGHERGLFQKPALLASM